MISIGNTLVSSEVLEEHFVCDLAKCKGECCIAGDSGAPLEDSELKEIETYYPEVKAMLQPEAIASIEKLGVYLKDSDNDWVTPLVNGNRECVYTIFENGIAKCSFEKAYFEGRIPFRKPVSCHLYPVRITKYKDFDAVNYDRWEVCAPACTLGKSLKVPVYKFLKDSLIRKYGDDWYQQLVIAADLLKESKEK
ncbi:DUF3109 family protein [soil metagenome]